MLIAAACGGGGSKSGAGTNASTGGATTTPGATGREFANFRLAYDTGIDFLDPGLSYTVEGWQLMWNIYMPLLGYRHVNGPDGATIVPYLAKALPTVSSDGKTYSLTLRKGAVYSDGTPVKASDFRFAIERDFKIDSPGVGFFSNIVGADQFGKTKTGHISGIKVNDGTGQITIRLTQPQGDFQNILATLFAAPVPSTTPAKDQSTTPIPSTGPYMIQSYKPNKVAILVRNPKWHVNRALGMTEVPNGNPDKMTVDIIGSDTIALQRTISGQDDYDFQQPPTDRLSVIQSKYADQYKTYFPANTYYFFMNSRVAPFNNLKARQAVSYAIDRTALTRVYGGLAQPTENLLPPTYPQYKKLFLYPHNLAKAKQLVQQSGTAGMQITVWNHDRGTDPKATAYLADILNKIGWKAKEKIVNSNVYWTTVGNQATKAQIGFADWFQDYPHPNDWFKVLVYGPNITETHNNNYGNVDIPEINAAISKLSKEPKLTPQINAQWANVDKMLDQNAGIAAFLNRQFIDFFNADMDLTGTCYTNHVLYYLDFALVCRKTS
ncbi:MAG TPA: ABC transporter substrate-binding protein [Gaiellaceae bacterium]|jgi:peptide/nickel transport system substrate-binding protein